MIWIILEFEQTREEEEKKVKKISFSFFLGRFKVLKKKKLPEKHDESYFI